MEANSKIIVVEGDITKLKFDAIVNAANRSLLGGGGVDGAIHRAAGPQLLAECKKLNGCSTGQAKITAGYNLPAKYVIHTVGPIWRGGYENEDELLAACYKNSMALAINYGIKSIAFPSISTGAYRFPIKRAAAIAIKTVRNFFESGNIVDIVCFVCFEKETYYVYTETLGASEKQIEKI